MRHGDESVEKNRTANSLQEIVKQFNDSFQNWAEDSDCVANFGWTYGEHPKKLEIISIDKIIYRKPPPSGEMLRDALGIGEQ